MQTAGFLKHADTFPLRASTHVLNLLSEPNPIQNSGNGVLCNKLSKLITITFEGGRCIGQMGSLSISY